MRKTGFSLLTAFAMGCSLLALPGGFVGESLLIGSAANAASHSVTAFVSTDDGIVPIDTTSARASTLITTRPIDPYQYAESTNGQTLYVLKYSNGASTTTLLPVKTSTRQVGTPISFGATIDAFAIAPHGTTAYAVAGTGKFKSANLLTGTTRTWGNLAGTISDGMAVTPDGLTVLISQVNKGEILAVDTTTGAVRTLVTGLQLPQSILLAPNSESGYVVGYVGIYPLNFADGSVGPVIGITGPRTLAFSPDGKSLYVTSGTGSIFPIATATNVVGTPIRVAATGDSAHGIAFTPNGAAAWVVLHNTNAGATSGGIAAEVDLASGKVLADLTMPQGATGIIIPPGSPGPSPKGYDLVGQDGGVFVFPPGQTSGFYGSLPGRDVIPSAPIVGIVPTVTDKGYFLVGQDGGVFSFGTAPFLGSLPGKKVVPAAPIVGIVAVNTDKGYFLVGQDGGVFSFGTAPFLGSLPGSHLTVHIVVGIAATPSGNGYWVVTTTGTVYAFGAAQHLGSASGTLDVSAIAGTPTGDGYWITTQIGRVFVRGKAADFGTLPKRNVNPSQPVIGIVQTADSKGYWLIGADGGVFAFGDAGYVGSLPASKIHVADIVGAVPA